jgi:O-antigen/teichoic acid export membrane protein
LNSTQMILSWVMAKWIPGLPRPDVEVRSLIAFGGKVAASYFVSNPIRSADAVLIGWRWGAGPLGLYSRAYNLLMLPVRQLGAPVGSVAIPAFSRTQSDPERFARYYLRTANLLTWISAPIFGFLFVAAEPIIVLTLGKRWQEAAPVFRLLAISAFAQPLLDSTVWLLVSRGESSRLLKLVLILSPIIVGSFVLGLPFGIRGVALSGSFTLIVIFPWILKFTFAGTRLTVQRLWRAVFCPISLCLAEVLFAELAMSLIAPRRVASQLLVAALAFVVVFFVAATISRVRNEIASFSGLLEDLRASRQAV